MKRKRSAFDKLTNKQRSDLAWAFVDMHNADPEALAREVLKRMTASEIKAHVKGLEEMNAMGDDE